MRASLRVGECDGLIGSHVGIGCQRVDLYVCYGPAVPRWQPCFRLQAALPKLITLSMHLTLRQIKRHPFKAHIFEMQFLERSSDVADQRREQITAPEMAVGSALIAEGVSRG